MVLVLPLLMMVPFLVYYAATGADVGASVTRLVDLDRPDARRRWPTSTCRWPG